MKELVEAIISGEMTTANEIFEQRLSEIICDKIEFLKKESKFSFQTVDVISEFADIVRKSKSNASSKNTKLDIQRKIAALKRGWSQSLKLQPNEPSHLTMMKKKYHLEI